ncbi:hypothetical protein PAMA_018690 [Pampus argenteus]
MAADVGSMFQYWKKFDLRRLQTYIYRHVIVVADSATYNQFVVKRRDELSRLFSQTPDCYVAGTNMSLINSVENVAGWDPEGRGELLLLQLHVASSLQALRPDSPGLHRTV